MLNEFSVTGLVQVVTTASVGVLPHIFNMVALKTSEERKKAQNETTKVKVKYLMKNRDASEDEKILKIQEDNQRLI